MKKKFIEPEIKRIELNLNENIASSEEPFYQEVGGMFKVTHGKQGCLENVQDTWLHFDNFDATDEGWKLSKDNGCFVRSPREAALMRGLPITVDMY